MHHQQIAVRVTDADRNAAFYELYMRAWVLEQALRARLSADQTPPEAGAMPPLPDEIPLDESDREEIARAFGLPVEAA